MDTQEQEWVNGFEGKTEAEILTAKLPPGISDEEAFGYRAPGRGGPEVPRTGPSARGAAGGQPGRGAPALQSHR